MDFSFKDESIEYTGRWDVAGNAAIATATGSYFDIAFEGKKLTLMFDTLTNEEPRLHLWISIDNETRYEVPIDGYLRIEAKNDGKHVCRVIYKGGVEQHRRWMLPLTGKVSFLGYKTEKKATLEKDTRKIIEFVGDSITEGVLVNADFEVENGMPQRYIDQNNRPFQDDVCETYAWLTAEALNLRPIIMGYGAVGVTRSGCGAVPEAPKAYPFNFQGSPITHHPDYVVINHGANDRGKKDPPLYCSKYGELLDVIRAHHPQAKIISLSAFAGAYHEELKQFIDEYNQKNNTNISFIDSTGWVPETPLHPLTGGHKIIAEHLIPILREIIK